MKNNTNTNTNKIHTHTMNSVQSHTPPKEAYLNLISECITAVKVSKEIISMTQTQDHYDLSALKTLHTKLASLRTLVLTHEAINLKSLHQALENCLTLSEWDLGGYVYSEELDLDQYLEKKRAELVYINTNCVIHTLELPSKAPSSNNGARAGEIETLCYAVGG